MAALGSLSAGIRASDYRNGALAREGRAPNDFGALDELAKRVMAFQDYYQQIARPFDWRFTRADLSALLARLGDHEPFTRLAA